MVTRAFLIVSTALFIFASQGCLLSRDIPHKSDDEMIQQFRENKIGFENLLEMIREDQEKIGDRLFRIDDDWTEPKDLEAYDISASRVREYRRRFEEVGVPRGFYAYNNDTYLFVASATGMATSGSSKGYVWKSSRPDRVVEADLDEYQKVHHEYMALRPIEGNWYLESSH
jgi:hypothetical protein